MVTKSSRSCCAQVWREAAVATCSPLPDLWPGMTHSEKEILVSGGMKREFETRPGRALARRVDERGFIF